jgi:hypothetical protein
MEYCVCLISDLPAGMKDTNNEYDHWMVADFDSHTGDQPRWLYRRGIQLHEVSFEESVLLSTYDEGFQDVAVG